MSAVLCVVCPPQGGLECSAELHVKVKLVSHTLHYNRKQTETLTRPCFLVPPFCHCSMFAVHRYE